MATIGETVIRGVRDATSSIIVFIIALSILLSWDLQRQTTVPRNPNQVFSFAYFDDASVIMTCLALALLIPSLGFAAS